MRNERSSKTSIRPAAAGAARVRAFSLAELLIVIAIIGVILAIAAPAFKTISKDIELKQARSDIFAALTAARSRAIRDRQMVALHIFRDGPAYAAARINATDPTNPDYNRSNDTRWGVMLDSITGLPQYGIPHVPTNKLVMRLEVANPCVDHLRFNNPDSAVEFICLGDHDPIVLPDSLGLARPDTLLDRYVATERGPIPRHYEDFYIVFGADGKLTTVLVDYDLAGLASSSTNTVAQDQVDSGGTVIPPAKATWSSSGLCVYDMQKFKNPGSTTQYGYINRADNRVMISPYTGMPLSMEVNQ